MGRPDFFIVGAPKAGTSAMAAHLGRHPEIFMSPLKEPQYFGFDQHHIGHRRRTLGEYLQFFDGAGEARRVGEASTCYLASRTAPEEIAAFAPGASIIVMLRDPVELMHAYHAEMVLTGFEPVRDFVDALAAEPERRRGRWLPDRSGVRENLYYRDIADLAPHVRRYLDVFGRERVHVILFDDWRAEPEQTYRDALVFLGVDPSFRPAFSVVNPSRVLRNIRVHDFLLSPPRPLKAASRLLGTRTRSMVRYGLLDLNTAVSPRPALDAALLRELRDEFAPKVAELARVIDRDLSGWSNGLPAAPRPAYA